MLESWIVDPVACCHKCGVNPPKSVAQRTCRIQAGIATEECFPVVERTSANTAVRFNQLLQAVSLPYACNIFIGVVSCVPSRIKQISLRYFGDQIF
jgi:hypothetical protein